MQKPRTLVAGRLPAEAEDRKRLRSRAVRVRQGPPPFRRAGRNRRDPASSQNAYHFLSRARAHARPGAHPPRPDDHGGGLVFRADPPQTPPLPLARTHAHARRGSSEGTPPLANVIALGPGRHKAPGDERGIEGPDRSPRGTRSGCSGPRPRPGCTRPSRRASARAGGRRRPSPCRRCRSRAGGHLTKSRRRPACPRCPRRARSTGRPRPRSRG